MASPVAADTAIVIDQGYVDTHLDIRHRFTAPRVFGLRSNAAPELGDYLKVSVRYEPYEGSSRALIMTSTIGHGGTQPDLVRARRRAS